MPLRFLFLFCVQKHKLVVQELPKVFRLDHGLEHVIKMDPKKSSVIQNVKALAAAERLQEMQEAMRMLMDNLDIVANSMM